MGRAIIPMEPITDPKKRKATFNSRNTGMIKKARELATLCDVNVSIIIFTDDQETPQIFPPDRDELLSSVDDYNRTRRANPDSIKRYTCLDYYADRKTKVEEQLVKEKKKILETKFPSWFGFLDGFSEAELREFALGLENKIVDVQRRLECLKNIGNVGLGLGLYNNNQQMGPSDSLMMNMQQMLNEDHVIYDGHENLSQMMLNEEVQDDNVIYGDENVSLDQLPPLMMSNEDHVIYDGHENFSQMLLNEVQDDYGDANVSLELPPLNEEEVGDNMNYFTFELPDHLIGYSSYGVQ